MTSETCRHGTVAPMKMLRALPESQGGLGRHRCAACAYDQAQREISDKIASKGRMIKCSHGKIAPESILKSLPSNQGGSGRHKCVICAYQEGRAHRRGRAVDLAWRPRETNESHSLSKVDTPLHIEQDSNDQDDDRMKVIGDLGEELVLEYERSSLLQAGRADLSNMVSHVAVVEGDAAGYDIRSYDVYGDVKYIEVKTTTSGKEAVFYLTENERAFGEAHSEQYYIYRLFELDMNLPGAKFFVALGDPGRNFLLKPTEYRVYTKDKE